MSEMKHQSPTADMPEIEDIPEIPEDEARIEILHLAPAPDGKAYKTGKVWFDETPERVKLYFDVVNAIESVPLEKGVFILNLYQPSEDGPGTSLTDSLYITKEAYRRIVEEEPPTLEESKTYDHGHSSKGAPA